MCCWPPLTTAKACSTVRCSEVLLSDSKQTRCPWVSMRMEHQVLHAISFEENVCTPLEHTAQCHQGNCTDHFSYHSLLSLLPDRLPPASSSSCRFNVFALMHFAIPV